MRGENVEYPFFEVFPIHQFAAEIIMKMMENARF